MRTTRDGTAREHYRPVQEPPLAAVIAHEPRALVGRQRDEVSLDLDGRDRDAVRLRNRPPGPASVRRPPDESALEIAIRGRPGKARPDRTQLECVPAPQPCAAAVARHVQVPATRTSRAALAEAGASPAGTHVGEPELDEWIAAFGREAFVRIHVAALPGPAAVRRREHGLRRARLRDRRRTAGDEPALRIQEVDRHKRVRDTRQANRPPGTTAIVGPVESGAES